jgi:hypothetical protein
MIMNTFRLSHPREPQRPGEKFHECQTQVWGISPESLLLNYARRRKSAGASLFPHRTSPEDNIFQTQCNDEYKYAHQSDRKRVIPYDCSDIITCCTLDEPKIGVGHVRYHARPGTDKKD